MLSDRNFAELLRLAKRCRPWTVRRPPWFLFQMWLRRRPMNHEFLVSPMADYLLSVGVKDTTLPQIAWPAWCHEFGTRMYDGCGAVVVGGPNVRDCLAALDSMRGWAPRMQHQGEA